MAVKSISARDYTLSGNELLMGEKTSGYVYRVKDLPNDRKPRERLIAQGPTNLKLTEVIALVLGVGTKKEEVLHMSERVLKEYGEKSIAHEISPVRMSRALDIPMTKACQLIAAFELGRRFYATKDGRAVFIRTADDAYEYLKRIGTLEKEQLTGLYLNSRYELIHEEIVSIGSLTANIVHPREIFKPALERGAVGVIIAHNHPSGNPEPTDADLLVTSQIKAAGDVLGIELLDHLIITDKQYLNIIR